MAGRRRRERLVRWTLRTLVAATFLIATAGALQAQGPGPRRRIGPGGAAPPYFLVGLPPGRQAMFQRNLPRWQAMSPGEQEFLRRRYEQRRDMRRVQAERAMTESGLRLDEDNRVRYQYRYGQERRRLERELRRAADAERTRRLPELNDRLRREFDPGATGLR